MMSMPRATSPCASVNTLPCSAVIMAAKASVFSFISCRNLFRMRARRTGGVSAHAGAAALAAATAAFTSSSVESTTWRLTAPVEGL